jgi:hypothetical protein
LCHHVRYDSDVPRAPYSVEYLLFRHRIGEAESFPLVLDEVWFYVRLEGTSSHDFWVEVGPAPDDGDDPADALGGVRPVPGSLRTDAGRVLAGLAASRHPVPAPRPVPVPIPARR